MKIIAHELSIINLILQINKDGKSRQFPLSELNTALKIDKKIKVLVEGDKFIDGEIKFDTQDKSFILKLIEERSFGIADGEIVIGLQKKLK